MRPALQSEQCTASQAVWEPTAAGFYRAVGGLEIAVTDQSYRGCGWVAHVSTHEPDRNGDIADLCGIPGHKTADEAKRAAEEWARQFCFRTLEAIGVA